MLEGKVSMTTFSALCLAGWHSHAFSAFTTTPNNWREWLMGQVLTQGTPFKKRRMTIKREGKETEGGAETPLTH